MNWTKKHQATGLVCFALVLITVALYWPARNFDFVQYDDDAYVFDNPDVNRGLTLEGVGWSLVNAHASNWHPVTWMSHMMDCQLFGLNPGGHHLVNVLLHGVNSALLFLLLRAMTGTFWRSVFVAVLFAWHPLRVESVAWISERKDVLSGFFFMLTLWMYVLHAARKSESPTADGVARASRFFYWCSLVFFIFGLMSKPMLVSVPVILLLIDFWPLGRFQSHSPFARPGRGVWREKIPYFVLAIVAGVITLIAQKSSGAMISLKSEGFASRLGNALTGYLSYLGKMLWPQDLMVLYLRPAASSMLTAAIAAGLLFGISAFTIVNIRRRPYLVTGWWWFVVMLLPVSGLLQAGLQSMADRYTYLPAIGLAIIVAWGGHELMMALLPGRAGRLALVSAAGVALVICAVLTRHQLAFWKNTETLMVRVLAIEPDNYIAHQNLGVYYSRLGLTGLAREHRQRLRELDPAINQETWGSPNTTP